MKNLPVEIIKKIQFSDFKTKKEECSKQESTSDFLSINITIDEKKNKGYFGKILKGYDSYDDHYEGSLLLNFFNNKQKISALASSNNINSTVLRWMTYLIIWEAGEIVKVIAEAQEALKESRNLIL